MKKDYIKPNIKTLFVDGDIVMAATSDPDSTPLGEEIDPDGFDGVEGTQLGFGGYADQDIEAGAKRNSVWDDEE